ncbi:MAG: hypothetical protein LH478_08260, partial [Chitinophagaceae bacterium]|nr:hypothetical protein [Chitinophagaceae bacterium]
LYKDEKDDQLKQFNVPDGLDIQNVLRITKDKGGNIVLLCYNGLYKIDTKGKLQMLRNQALEAELNKNEDYPEDIIFDQQGHFWLVTHRFRLYTVNPETGHYNSWAIPETDGSREFDLLPKRIIKDENDNIWIGAKNDLEYFNRKTGLFSVFNTGTKKDLEHMPVTDMELDSFGTLWIATLTRGLIKYEERPRLKSYSFNKDDKNSLTSGWASQIYETSDHKIWVTTNDPSSNSGLSTINMQSGTVHPMPYSGFIQRINTTSAIWENKPGEMYLGVNRGLYSFLPANNLFKRIQLPGIPDSINITFYFKDSRQNEWVSTFNGLYKKVPGAQQYRHYDVSQVQGSNASSNEITQVKESNQHGLWLLTNNGLFLYKYDTNKIERHGFDKTMGDIFITQDINSFYEDPEGIAWVGTWQGGLSRYNVETKKIKTYNRNDGLPSMSIQAILADEKNGTLWLSTFEGLSRFNLKTEQFNNFDIEDGIQSQLFADGAALKTSAGLFVFGGSNGVTVFNPDEISKNSMPPKVFLTDLKLFNKSVIPGQQSILKKPINETQQITLTHNQNNISLDFIALHYSNPLKNRYAYKLDNYDNEWRDVGNLHVAFYPNLPPGEYLFQVKAANDKGVWNEEGASLKITVLPPWWRTIWAYVLYGLLFIAIAFAIDRYFRRRLIKKERERNNARELEQAKEIEKAYYKLEQTHETLKATQTQLIQSEKMASLGELTAGIAHEIQNPLNFVNNFSEVSNELIDEMKEELNKGHNEDAVSIANDIKQNLEKINYHGKRADSIVKGMLQHSRSSKGEKEPTDINALADEYLRLAYQGLRAKDQTFNATIKTDFDPAIGKINIIPQDIGRVLLNLYNNAFFAIAEKKRATDLEGFQNLQGLAAYQPTVLVSTKKIGDKISISVNDNGNGIPQKNLDKIFQPFFTTKPTGQCTGLGLSLSYDIVKAHGGDIKVETKVDEGNPDNFGKGEGTEFIIILPIIPS